MGQVKHMMDEVAKRLEIKDPNDPRVQAEVERRLSINDRRLVLVESHPNSGGFWIGRIGTEREIQEYLKQLEIDGTLDYVFAIAELKPGAGNEVTDWIEFDSTEPVKLQKRKPCHSITGPPPLPGLEARLATIQSAAYGQRHSVWSILLAFSDDEVAETFTQVLESILQEDRTLDRVSERG